MSDNYVYILIEKIFKMFGHKLAKKCKYGKFIKDVKSSEGTNKGVKWLNLKQNWLHLVHIIS